MKKIIKNFWVCLVVLMMTSVVFASVPVSAQKAQMDWIEDLKAPSVDIKWIDKGYEITVSIPQDISIYLIVKDKDGKQNQYKFKFDGKTHSLWISQRLASSELYLAIFDLNYKLKSDTKERVEAMNVLLYKLDITGKGDKAVVSIHRVLDTKLILELVVSPRDITDNLDTGADKTLVLNRATRNDIRKGFGENSCLYSTHTIELLTHDPYFTIDSFFDVFVDLNFDGPGMNDRVDSFFDITYSLNGGLYHIDSFFDVFTELSIDPGNGPGGNIHRDSFFDVFVDISVPTEDAKEDYGPHWTTIVNFDAWDSQNNPERFADSFFDVFTEATFRPGSNEIWDDCDIVHFTQKSNIWIDIDRTNSFFDVFTEIKLGMELKPVKDSEGATDGFFDVFTEAKGFFPSNPSKTDSFFDVFVETDALFPSGPAKVAAFDVMINTEGMLTAGKGYSFFDVFAETEGLFPSGPAKSDSFFDVFVDTKGLFPSGPAKGNSFFDVFTEVELMLPIKSRQQSYGPHWSSIMHFETWNRANNPVYVDPELSISYGSETQLPGGPAKGDSFFDVFVDTSALFPSGPAKGAHCDILLDTTGLFPSGPAKGDSFFDVFTELSIDGNDWDLVGGLKGRQNAMQKDPSVPGAAVDSFFDVFTTLKIDDNDYDTETAMQSGLGITAEDDWEAPNCIVDSFFDVFTELTIEDGHGPGGKLFIDSFFDVFKQLRCNVDSEDITSDVTGRSSVTADDDWETPMALTDSFFDVFTKASIDDNGYDMVTGVSSGAGVTATDDWEAPSTLMDSFFDVFTEIKHGSNDPDWECADSFFDVFTEHKFNLAPDDKSGDDNLMDSFFDVFATVERTDTDDDNDGCGDSFFDVFTESKSMVETSMHYFEYNSLGQVETEEIYDQNTGEVIDSFFDVFFEIEFNQWGRVTASSFGRVSGTSWNRIGSGTWDRVTESSWGRITGGAWNRISSGTWNRIGSDSWGRVSSSGWGRVTESAWGRIDSGTWGRVKSQNQYVPVLGMDRENSIEILPPMIKGKPGTVDPTHIVLTESKMDMLGDLLSNYNGNFHIDSFFDVFTELTVDEPVRKYVRMNLTSIWKLKYLKNDKPDDGKPAGWDIYHNESGNYRGGNYATDSFFDVFTESVADMFAETLPDDIYVISLYSTQKGLRTIKPERTIESFFDVFVDSRLDISFGEEATGPISPPPEDVFHIDSFFDVFVELSVDGGESFFDVFKKSEVSLDIRSESTGPISPPPERIISIESMLDLFAKGVFSPGGWGVAADSFFDVFVDTGPDNSDSNLFMGEKIMLQHPTFDFPAGGGVYSGPGSETTAQADTSMAFKLPATSGFSAHSDSFFDVFIDVDLDEGIFHIDSFFDVFTELEVDPGTPDEDNESVRLRLVKKLTTPSLKLFKDDGTPVRAKVSIQFKENMKFEPTNPKEDPDDDTEGLRELKTDDETVNSFFDVFTETSVNVGLDDSGNVMGVEPSPFHLDSWIDLFYQGVFSPGGWGLSTESFFDVFTELSVDGGGLYRVDSFFDVFTELSVDGGGLYHIDSFFDVFTELSVDGGGLYHIDSFFDVFTELSVDGGGLYQIDSFFDVFTELSVDGGGLYQIDSFFDVFTELSVDGGNSWIDSFFDLGTEISADGGGLYHIDSFFDVFTELSVDGGQNWFESFFDVFTELSVDGGESYHIDSFFDVFTELSVDGGGLYQIDSFFDVFTELSVDGGGLYHIDSFFDVFTELSVDGDGLYQSDSFFDVFTELSVDGDGLYHIDSFFDVFTELSVDGGGLYQSDSFFDVFTELTLDSSGDVMGVEPSPFHVESSLGAELKIKGTVEGNIDESYEVSFDGSIELKNDVEKEFGESVKVGIAAGGKLTVHVENNAFKGAELTGVVITASVKISDIEFELEGSVEGNINENYEVSLDGSIELKNDVEKEFGESVKVGIAAGAKLTVQVPETDDGPDSDTDSFFDVFTELKVESDVTSTLTVKGDIKGEYRPGPKIDFTGTITVEQDFVYKKGKVEATLKSEGRLTVEVEKNKFKSASFGTELDVNCEVESDVTSTLKIKGKIDGKYETGAGFDLTGSLTLVPPFQYKKGKLEIDLKSSFSLSELSSDDSENYHIDSFFDVFVGLSVDGGESFFDITYELDISGNDDNGERECPECGASVGTEDKVCPECGEELPEDTYTSINSFFDVFVELSVDGGESFFDVFTELSVDGGESFSDVTYSIGCGHCGEHSQIESSITFNGRGIDLNEDGLDIKFDYDSFAETLPDDFEGLARYTVDLDIYGLIAGKEPKYDLDVTPKSVGDTKYESEVKKTIETVNEKNQVKTSMVLAITVFDVFEDEETGLEVRVVAFVHIIEVVLTEKLDEKDDWTTTLTVESRFK